MRTVVGLVILVVHALMIYSLRGAVSVPHRASKSSAYFFVAQILDASRPKLSLDLPPPMISKVELPLATPAFATVEIDESVNPSSAHFEPARADSSRSVTKLMVDPVGGRHPSTTITLLVEVLADGTVGRVEIKASAGAELDALAKRYVRGLRWTPANIEGKPVPMKVLYSLAL